jgi:hypothetical protein
LIPDRDRFTRHPVARHVRLDDADAHAVHCIVTNRRERPAVRRAAGGKRIR